MIDAECGWAAGGARIATEAEPTRTGQSAVEAEAVGMRLNQMPAEPSGITGPFTSPGGQPSLVSTPAQKSAAARAIEEHIEPDTRTSGGWADEETAAVVKEFDARDGHGWLASAAIKKAHKTWGDQVKSLMDRLSSEKGALRSTNNLFQKTDFGVHARVRNSSLDQY
ncbi:hypothetical protein [Streptomyces xanthochromogenes]|uniref:hypothetical protein n=1 Tax=Streptomyces xanthochromogenes TaxID=67384 RepID=UPI002F3E4F4B